MQKLLDVCPEYLDYWGGDLELLKDEKITLKHHLFSFGQFLYYKADRATLQNEALFKLIDNALTSTDSELRAAVSESFVQIIKICWWYQRTDKPNFYEHLGTEARKVWDDIDVESIRTAQP